MTVATKAPVQEVYRLSREVYDKLERSFPPLVVTLETTEHYAGYMLGIALVLKRLREDIVV